MRTFSPRRSIKRVVFGICGLFSVFTIYADNIVFDSFGPSNTYDTGSVFVVGLGGSLQTEWAAQFTAQASGFLSTVELALTSFSIDPTGPVNVFLYGSVNDLPDNSDQIFLGSVAPIGVFPTNNNVATLTVSSPVFVSLASTYWLVLKPATANGVTLWNYSSNVSGRMLVSVDDSTWQQTASSDPRIAAFRINAVPEPATTALLTGGGVALGALIRQRRNKNRD